MLKHQNPNTPDYDYHSEPLRQQNRFVEGGVFEGKDSETVRTAQETNISTKTPDNEYHSEPLRQHRSLVDKEISRKRVQKERKIRSNCSTIFKDNILLFALYFLVTACKSFSFQF